jgi:large subunit ribosomal protein L10
MPTPAKATIIEEMTEKLKQSRAAVLLQTEGLTVAEMQELRRRLRTAGIELIVIKNTLLRIASERASYKDLSGILTGPTSIALSVEDEVAPAKTISEYMRQVKTGKPVVIKAGILDNAPISAAQVEALAKVPPRDQLHAEVVGAVQGPLSQTYGVLSAPLRDLINVLEARIRVLGGDTAA